MMKKLIALVLCSLVLIVPLSGCVKDNFDGVNESGLPEVTLEWFVNSPAMREPGSNSMLLKEIYRKTGVRLKFSKTEDSVGDSKLSGMVMTGNLPDIVSVESENGVYEQAIDGGNFWSMDELFSTYTEVKDFLPSSMYDWGKYTPSGATEGKLWGIRSHFFDTDTSSDNLLTSACWVIRQDYLEKYNLDPVEDFNTFSKFKDSLTKIYNGEQGNQSDKKLIPYYSDSRGIEFVEAFAIAKEDAQGNYRDWRMTPEARDLVEKMADFNKSGLMPINTLTNVTMQEAFLQDRVISAYLNWANQGELIVQAYKRGVQYTAIGPIRNDNGDRPMYTPWTMNGWMSTSITKNSKYPDRALKLLEFLLSEEGKKLTLFGIENETYRTVEEDGITKYQNIIEATGDARKEMDEKYGGEWIGVLLEDSVWRYKHLKPGPMEEDEMVYDLLKYFSEYAFNTRALESIHPKSGEVSIYFQNCETAFNWNAILMASNPINEYEKAINLMKTEYNYDKVYQYMNNRFKENKQILGVDYIWPTNLK